MTVGVDCATPRVKAGAEVGGTERSKVLMVPEDEPLASIPARWVPRGAEALAVRVSTLDWPKEIEAGLKAAVTPEGSCGADSLKAPTESETETAVTRAVAVPPCAMVDG